MTPYSIFPASYFMPTTYTTCIHIYTPTEFRAVRERPSNDSGRALFLLKRKLQFCRSNPVELLNIFNLLKEKSILDVPLLEEVLMALSRCSDCSQKSLLAAFEDFFEWNRSGRVLGSDGFFLRFSLSCYSNNLLPPARHVEALLLSNNLANVEDFRSGHLCVIIQQNQLSTVKDATLKFKQTKEELNNFQKNIRYYSIEQINLVIRILAKYRMTEDIFSLFDCIREARVKVWLAFYVQFTIYLMYVCKCVKVYIYVCMHSNLLYAELCAYVFCICI